MAENAFSEVIAALPCSTLLCSALGRHQSFLSHLTNMSFIHTCTSRFVSALLDLCDGSSGDEFTVLASRDDVSKQVISAPALHCRY